MTGRNDIDERDLLIRELKARAAGFDSPGVGFDAVRDGARRVRRRRAVAGVAVAAAVVTGVVLPVGLAVAPDGQELDRPVEQPTVTRPSEPAREPRPDGTFPLTLEGLPRGEEPQVSYVVAEDRTLFTAEGRVELPEAYSQITAYRDGWLAVDGGQNGYETVVLDEDLQVQRRTPGGAGIVTDADDSRVLHVRRGASGTTVVDEPVTAGDDRAAVSWRAPGPGVIVPVGYLDEGTVVFQTSGEPDAAVTMGTADDAPATVPLEGFLRVTAASEATGLVAGQTSWNPRGSCWGVMRPAESTSDLVWETCDYSLYGFSPDGRYVIAGPPDFDFWGPGELTVLEVGSWEPVVRLRPERGVAVQVSQATWEDADTIVAVLTEGEEFGVVRVELSGRLELVSDTHPSTNMNLPLWLADLPRG